MSLLPRSPELTTDAGPRVVGVDSEDADALMSALSSETARCILSELHEEPAPPAEIADRVDTTLQNAQYHLERLKEAGAIEIVGTAYSEKGREMDVYAPADEPLVIFAGREESVSGLRAALGRLLGGFAALALGALVVQELFGRRSLASLLPLGSSRTGGDGGGSPAAGETETPKTVTKTAEEDAVAAEATPTPEAIQTGAAGGDGGGGTLTPAVAETQTSTEAAAATPTPKPLEGADAGGTATPTPSPEVTETAANVTATTTDAVQLVAESGGLPPGLLFFLGGALVLTVGVAATYARR